MNAVVMDRPRTVPVAVKKREAAAARAREGRVVASLGQVYRVDVPIPMDFLVKATARAKPAVLAKRERVMAGFVSFHASALPFIGDGAVIGVNVAVPLGEPNGGTAVWRPSADVVVNALFDAGVVGRTGWLDNDVVVSRGSSGLKQVAIMEIVVAPAGATLEFTPRFSGVDVGDVKATAASMKALAAACRKTKMAGPVAAADEPVEVRVAVPMDCLLSMNQRLDRFKVTSMKRSLAELMTLQCLDAPAIDHPVRMRMAFEFPTTGHQRDAENWGPTRKALIDAVVRSGVLEDDDARFVRDGGMVVSSEPSGLRNVAIVTLTLAPLVPLGPQAVAVTNGVAAGLAAGAGGSVLVVAGARELESVGDGLVGLVSFAAPDGFADHPGLADALRECERVLRPGGVLIVTWSDREAMSAACERLVGSVRVHDFVGGATFMKAAE